MSYIISFFISLSVTGLLLLLQQYRYWRHLKRKFHNQEFNVYHKRFPDEIVQKVKCKVKGNVIKFTGRSTSDNTPFEGEFIMNVINLKMGDGHQTHIHDDAYGFTKIIIKNNDTFFVEAPYTKTGKNTDGNIEGSRVYQAFVWKKVVPNTTTEVKNAVKAVAQEEIIPN